MIKYTYLTYSVKFYLYNHLFQTKIKNTSSTTEDSLMSPSILLIKTLSYHHGLVLSILEPHIREITQYELFCAGFFSSTLGF